MRGSLRGTARLAVGLVAALATAAPALADGDREPLEVEWSATLELMITDFSSPEDDDDLSGFFDLYEYTPNKDSSLPTQLGLTAFDLDLFREEESPLLKFRLRSPSSNLGITGEDIDEPFLNQRAELLLRPRGAFLDIDYWRFRSDDLRLFPNPTGVGNGFASAFNDDTDASDRFYSQRTGFAGELRLFPEDLLGGRLDFLDWLSPELAVRGGFEHRSGQRQFRYLLDGSDVFPGFTSARWRALATDPDQDVSDVGSELVFEPGGWFTLALDFDYQGFREDASPVLQSDVAALDLRVDGTGNKGPKTIGFVPDTHRLTGTARLQRRFGDWGAVHGALQLTRLDQSGTKTPSQRAESLSRNQVIFYSGNLAGDLRLGPALSANVYFKFDNRRNRIDRDTALFNPTDGSQVYPFVKQIRWLKTGTELSYRPYRTHRIAIGYRGEWIDRTLEFSTPANPLDDRILPENSLLDDDSETHDFYLRTRLRPLAGLQFSGEVGYKIAPKTGYIRELDNVSYGNARVSYTLPLARPVTLSAFGGAESGKNKDFSMVSTDFSGAEIPGGRRDRDFERDTHFYGLTLTGSPRDDLTLFASFTRHHDAQDFDLVRSTVRRFKEPSSGVEFFTDSPLDYRGDLLGLSVGSTAQLSDRTDASVAYTFTRSNVRFRSSNATSSTLDGFSRIRSDIHDIAFDVGHWLRDGLRVFAGYRFQDYEDRSQGPPNGGSSLAPFGLSTRVHSVTLGVTLTSNLLEN